MYTNHIYFSHTVEITRRICRWVLSAWFLDDNIEVTTFTVKHMSGDSGLDGLRVHEYYRLSGLWLSRLWQEYLYCLYASVDDSSKLSAIWRPPRIHRLRTSLICLERIWTIIRYFLMKSAQSRKGQIWVVHLDLLILNVLIMVWSGWIVMVFEKRRKKHKNDYY